MGNESKLSEVAIAQFDSFSTAVYSVALSSFVKSSPEVWSS